MRRANNQDSHAVVLATDTANWQSRGHIFMVADGMGAHAAGELASKIAADQVPHLYRKYEELAPPDALLKAFIETNGEVHRRGQANNEFRNMGTTASTLVLLPQGAFVAHIGDSRIYRVRREKLEQLTRDHSLVWELREAGQLSENAELAHSIPKNVITRSVGPNPVIEVDLEGPLATEVGDTFLLCSDGLTGRVTDTELASVLSHLAPREAADLLVALANLRGGPDNITIIIAKIVGPELASVEVSAEPLRMGRSSKPPRISPVLWVAMAVCFLGGLGLLIIGRIFPALAAMGSGCLLLFAVWLQWQRHQRRGVELREENQLGRGPYTETECPTGSAFAESLSAIVAELRNSRAARNFEVDWTEFDELRRTAAESQTGQHYEPAIRDYSRAVSLLMEHIRIAMNRAANDSAIEL